jgi:hypothetical protein
MGGRVSYPYEGGGMGDDPRLIVTGGAEGGRRPYPLLPLE